MKFPKLLFTTALSLLMSAGLADDELLDRNGSGTSVLVGKSGGTGIIAGRDVADLATNTEHHRSSTEIETRSPPCWMTPATSLRAGDWEQVVVVSVGTGNFSSTTHRASSNLSGISQEPHV